MRTELKNGKLNGKKNIQRKIKIQQICWNINSNNYSGKQNKKTKETGMRGKKNNQTRRSNN